MADGYLSTTCNMDQTFESRAALRRAFEAISVPFDHIPADNMSLRSRIKRRQFESVIFAETYLSAPCVSERSAVPGATSEEYVCVTAHTTGSHWFNIDGAEFAVKAGDVHVWSSLAKCRAVSLGEMGGRSIMIPRKLLAQRFGNIDDLCGRRAAAEAGATHLLYMHLLALHDSLDRFPKDRLTDAIWNMMDLLQCCLPDTPADCSGSKYHQDLFVRCVRYIRNNITDTELTLLQVANHLGISTRSLQQLFTRADTTFSAFLRGERLKLAAQALEAPSFARLSVTELAHRYGFYDLAHFSRSFKAQFAISPVEYRRRAIA